MDDDAHGKAEEIIQLAHPLGITLGQVVVHRDQMHALFGQGIEHDRQGSDQGLTFTGLHFSDLALMQNDPAHQLAVEVAHVEHPLACLADQGVDLGQKIIHGFPRGNLFLPGRDLLRKCLILEAGEVRLEFIDPFHQGTEFLQKPLVFRSKDFFDDSKHSECFFGLYDEIFQGITIYVHSTWQCFFLESTFRQPPNTTNHGSP